MNKLFVVRRKMNMILVFSAIAVAILINPNTALSVTFNFTYNEGFEQQEQNKMIYAGRAWSYYLADNVTVNVKVGWGDPDIMGYAGSPEGAIVAQTGMKMKYISYAFMRDLMVYDESQEISRNGLVRWLPNIDEFSTDKTVSNQLVIFVTQAQWKALGLVDSHKTIQ